MTDDDEPEDPIETIMQAVLDEADEDWQDSLADAVSQAVDNLNEDLVAEFERRLKAAGMVLDESLMARFRTFVDENHADGASLLKDYVMREM